MKRIMVLFVLIVCFVLPGAAVAEDFSAMSNDDIATLILNGRNELARRAALAENNRTIYDQDGIIVQLTGEPLFEPREQNGDYLEQRFTIINDTENRCYVASADLYVNGWKVVAYSDGGFLEPYARSRDNVFKFGGLKNLADVASLDQIEIAKLQLRVSTYKPDGKFVNKDMIADLYVDVPLVYSSGEGFLVISGD